MRRSLALVGCALALASLLVACAGLWADDLQQLRRRLETMSAQEREELMRKRNRFYDLPLEEQQRLRQFHQEVTTAPDAQKLQAVMARYHDWLKTLQPGERAELRGLPPDKRIVRIKQLLENQALQRFRQLTESKLEPADAQQIFQWLREYVTRHEDELVQSMPPNEQNAYREAIDPRFKGFLLTRALLRQDVEKLNISNEEVADLLARLSPSARSLLPKETEPQQRNRLIRTWIDVALFSVWWRERRPVSDDELTQFLENELSDRDREYLDGLPTAMFRREAERLYYFYKSRKERAGQPGRGRGSEPGFAPPPGRGGPPRGESDRHKPPPAAEHSKKTAAPK